MPWLRHSRTVALSGCIATACLAAGESAHAQPPAPQPPTAPTAGPRSPATTAPATKTAATNTPAGSTGAPEPALAELDVATIDYVPYGIAGLATFGASWVGTIVMAVATDSGDRGRAAGHSVVPVGGPFIMLAEGSHAPDIEGALAGLGALQGLGLAAAFIGFSLESKVVTTKSGAFVAPTLSPTSIGLAGAF